MSLRYERELTRRDSVRWDDASTGKGSRVTLAFKDVSFSVQGRKILDECSGVASSGELVAVMGPSGCGKTTLLDCLANKKTAPYQGTFTVNGAPRDRLYGRLTAYVPQEDVHLGYLTVRETVTFEQRLMSESAGLSGLEAGTNAEVDETLALLGLDGIADTLVGDSTLRGISGGQKRRLSLARKIVCRVSLLFADEPTSGLSSADAEIMMRAIKLLTRKRGTGVVLVIHQPRPEVAELFDQLWLLAPGPGRFVYTGGNKAAQRYFEAAGFPVPAFNNPTDFYLDVITPESIDSHPEELVEYFNRTQRKAIQDAVEREMSTSPPQKAIDILRNHLLARGIPGDVHDRATPTSFTRQISVLMNRKLLVLKRDLQSLKQRLGICAVQGVIIGLIFQGIGKKLPVQQVAFAFAVCYDAIISNLTVLPGLVNARFKFKLDQSDSLYSSLAYCTVETVTYFALSISFNFITVLINFSFSGYEWKHFQTIYCWSLLCFFAMSNFFKMIAACAPTGEASIQTATPGLLITVMFSNFFVSRATAPVYLRWCVYVSPMAWAIEQILTALHPDDADLITVYGYDFSHAQTIRAVLACVFAGVVCQALEIIALERLNPLAR
uniref:ABC transporter domain-containing protein n=1 Tax=Ostreococcus mediterraneus TaxID=1486918 RepID=A0A7S0WJA2_9CHLO|mmetsp:Transcript_4354/g.9403  ORF Transcript_4354/g.9403 Transcript_4354/m.9403 type:complete len:609 (+) Transcript_4354:1726-3552(+)